MDKSIRSGIKQFSVIVTAAIFACLSVSCSSPAHAVVEPVAVYASQTLSSEALASILNSSGGSAPLEKAVIHAAQTVYNLPYAASYQINEQHIILTVWSNGYTIRNDDIKAIAAAIQRADIGVDVLIKLDDGHGAQPA